MQDVGQAEARVYLRRLAAGRDPIFPVARRAMSDGKPYVGLENLPIERAEAEGALGIFDGSRRLTGVAEDNRTRAKRPSGRAGQRQRAIDGVHRSLVIMIDKA